MKWHHSCWYYCFVLAFVSFITCKAQEKPAFDNRLHENGVTHRSNFCLQQKAVEKGKTSIRNALKGLDISVALFSYQLDEETGTIDESNPDLAIQILDEIARRAGFTYRNTFGILDSATGNTTWADIQDSALDIYDVMGDWYYETTDRLNRGIIYPEGWYDGNMILLQRKNMKNSKFNMFAFGLPFSPQVWLLIGVFTIISGITYYVLDYFDSRLKKKKMDIGFEESLFYTTFSFSGHFVHQPKSRETRILIFSLGFFYLIIVAAYTANLANFLVSKNKPSRIDINYVQDGKLLGLTFCVWKNTATDEHLQSFHIPESKIHREEKAGEEFLALSEGKCDLLLASESDWEIHQRSSTYNPDCKLERVGRIEKFQSGGFSMKDSEIYCTSLLRNVFHLHMIDMKNSLMLDNIWNRRLETLTTNDCTSESAIKEKQKYEEMGIENLGGIFVLHSTALIVAVLWTLFRVWYQPRHKKKEMVSELRNALQGERGLNKAAASARYKKSINVKPLRKAMCISATSQSAMSMSITELDSEKPTQISSSHGESYLDSLFDAGNNKHSSTDMSALFHENKKLSQRIEIVSDDVEELRRNYCYIMERKDEEHKHFIGEICKEHREEIKSMCSKHDKEMKEKNANIEELIQNSLKEQVHTIFELLHNSKR